MAETIENVREKAMLFEKAAAPAAAEAAPSPASTGAVPPQSWKVLGILSLLMGFASISTDLYLPAMPAMTHALGASVGMIEWTVSSYLIGFSLGQLVWGPVSDHYGRRLPVAIGIVLFVIGSAGCALAPNVSLMIVGRIIQASGASACVVLSRAMVRDLYAGDRAAQMLSTLIAVMAVAPLLGPLVGGQILVVAGWHAIFWTLVVVGIVTLPALLTLPETLPAERRDKGSLGDAFLRYGELLRRPRILGYAGVGGFHYAAMFAYVAGTPFAYISYHHVPAQFYGLLFGAGIIGFMIANTVSSRLVSRIGSDRVMQFGTILAAVAGIVAAIAARTDAGGLLGLAIPLFVLASSMGLIVANSIAGAMNDYPARTGSVSALVGGVQYGSGVISSGLVGMLADGTPWPMGIVIALTSVAAVLCTFLVSPISKTSANRPTIA